MSVREEMGYCPDILAHRIVDDRDPGLFEIVKLGSHQNIEYVQPHIEAPKVSCQPQCPGFQNWIANPDDDLGMPER
jgi:hypothetical protein